jgi:tRNA threonylcarbamoyl adenosine modification protein YeaZ
VLVLAIDTSTPAVTAGVVTLDGADVLGERVTLDARAHGELLTPHVLDAVTAANVSLSALEAIVCGVGPGPFTGLRAGMATAAALGHSLAVPVYPVCGLDAIAADVVAAPGADNTGRGPFAVVIDARRREVYWALYDADGVRTDGPHVQHPADLTGLPSAAGAGARLYAEVLCTSLLAPEYPSPRGLVFAARSSLRVGEPPEPLTPLYLRRPDAVESAARKRVTV